ncbi:MAG: hypothetical protein PHO02_04320 [Candidatus Nanoarchaeia archaeon]|nr:hypothetical protein [Candidatus Nanoarchaeia archaeon]
MKNSIMFMAILGVLAMLAAGCTGPAGSTGYYKYTGDKMVTASFVRDAPVSLETAPYEKGDDIDVAVELTNKLPEDVPAGKVKVRLTGDATMPNFFTGAKEMLSPLLKKMDENGIANPDEIELGPIKFVGDVSGKITKTITGQYCYSYPVKVKANLFYTAKAEEIGSNLDSGSNPPSSVQVIAITQRPVDVTNNVGELDFKVTIKNKGTGTVVASLGDCFKFRDRREKQELKLEAKGAYNIECEKGGIVTLQEDTQEKIVDCTVKGIDPANLGKVPSELTLTLTNFAYEDEIAPVTIWLEA